MATKYYVGSGGDWNTAANWADTSGGTGPPTDSNPAGAADAAIFDANSGACTLDAAAACLSLTLGTSGSVYNAKLDAATYNVTIGTGGLDCTYATGVSCELDLGTGTWECAGHWSNDNITLQTRDTSTVKLTGTSKNLVSDNTQARLFYNLEITGTITHTAGQLSIYGTLTVSGTLTSTAGQGIALQSAGGLNTTGGTINLNHADAVLTVNVAGSFTNAGTITGTLGRVTVTFGSFTSTGTFSVPNLWVQSTAGNTSLGPGTYSCASAIKFRNTGTSSAYTVTLGTAGSQTITLDGPVTMDTTSSGTLNISAATYDPNIVITGSITVTDGGGDIVYTKGDGTLTLNGTNNVTITTPASFTSVLEALVINKTSGRVTLAGDLYVTSFTLTDGDFDLDGNTLDSAGSVSVAAGARFHNGVDTDMDGGVIDIATGTLTLTGAA